MGMFMKNKMMKNSFGGIAIEAAIILPIFILFLLGVIDFGYFFTQSQMSERSLTAVSDAVANNPSSQQLGRLVQDQRELMSFGSATGTLCAQAYLTPNEAQAGRCLGNTFNVASPNPAATEYFVALSSRVDRRTLTGFFDSELPPIESFNVVRVDLGLRNIIDQLTNELSSIRSNLADTENRLTTRISDLESELGEEKRAPKWGGSFQTYPNGDCRAPNPVTGACSCAKGAAHMISEFSNPGGLNGRYCDNGRTDCGYIAYGCY